MSTNKIIFYRHYVQSQSQSQPQPQAYVMLNSYPQQQQQQQQQTYVSSRGLSSHEAAPESPEIITYSQSGETNHQRTPSTVAPAIEYAEHQDTSTQVRPSIRYTSTPTNVQPLQYATQVKHVQPIQSVQHVHQVQHIQQVPHYQPAQFIQPQQYYQYPQQQYIQQYSQQYTHQYAQPQHYPQQSLQAPVYDFYGFHNRHPTSLLDSYIPSSVLIARHQKQFQSNYYQPQYSKQLFQPAALDALSAYNTIAYSVAADESSHAKRSSAPASTSKATKSVVPNGVAAQKKA